jgi:hypothetical protein
MQLNCESPTWAIVRRQVSALLLIGAAVSAPATAQPARESHSVAFGLASPVAPLPSPESPLPVNLLVPDSLAPRVISMWRQSPTFRRQCARLAEHPHVIVQIALVNGVRGAVARSRVGWRKGSLTASVQIDLLKPERMVEAIAHELEHVLEQIDGRDLPLLAARGLEGVVDRGNAFETARARSVGRTVASEVRRP